MTQEQFEDVLVGLNAEEVIEFRELMIAAALIADEVLTAIRSRRCG